MDIQRKRLLIDGFVNILFIMTVTFSPRYKNISFAKASAQLEQCSYLCSIIINVEGLGKCLIDNVDTFLMSFQRFLERNSTTDYTLYYYIMTESRFHIGHVPQVSPVMNYDKFEQDSSVPSFHEWDVIAGTLVRGHTPVAHACRTSWGHISSQSLTVYDKIIMQYAKKHLTFTLQHYPSYDLANIGSA